jgi:hypothetical protein
MLKASERSKQLCPNIETCDFATSEGLQVLSNKTLGKSFHYIGMQFNL